MSAVRRHSCHEIIILNLCLVEKVYKLFPLFTGGRLMDTRIATTQIRMQNWVEIIQDRNASGLTIDDYCKAHELSRNAYFYWLRKIRDAALESKSVSFTEVPLSDLQTEMAALDFQPKLTVQIGNAVVRVNESTPKRLLTMVCEVLSNV